MRCQPCNSPSSAFAHAHDGWLLLRTGSFYAVPDGTPPAGGWPVYVDFLAQPYANTSVFSTDAEAQCGNGWIDPDAGYGPPTPPECFALLGADTGCPRPKFQVLSFAVFSIKLRIP